MPIAALMPIRSFATGKGRLGSVVTPEQRFRLGVALAGRTVDAAESAGMLPAIVTADRDVTAWAAGAGLVLVDESGPGLDAAGLDGVTWASSLGMQWVVIHSDLPLVSPDDFIALAEPVAAGHSAIAPSSDGGTTAISSSQQPRFAFGPGSFHRHLATLAAPVVIARTGLLHDLDSPEDLVSAMSHREGGWLSEVVDVPLIVGDAR